MSFTCSICGRHVTFWEVAYIGNSLIICKRCYPDYYVKHCPLVRRRLAGELPQSCNYCLYRSKCDEYIKSSLKGSNPSQ
ncbi:MAG: hypothetical protein ACP5GZ_09715 [Vulcanisaeta sp.]|uniref:hypothetical protein n=1 Tax=Vulcanisaeta sp. TaxID=2020871 RepID=UPI003D0FDC1B